MKNLLYLYVNFQLTNIMSYQRYLSIQILHVCLTNILTIKYKYIQEHYIQKKNSDANHQLFFYARSCYQFFFS